MKKRILIVSEYFYPHWTGLSQSIFQMAKELRGLKYEVTVLTTRFDQNLKSFESASGINIIRSSYLFRFSRTHYSITSLSDFVRLCRQTDCVIINSPHSNIFFFSTIAKILGKKLVIFHQGDLVLPRKTGVILVNWLIERIFDIVTWWSFFLADVISTYTKDYCKNSRVMYYFIKKFIAYIPPFNSESQPSETMQNRLEKLKKNHMLIGFAGRFVEEKGFDILLRAIADVVEKLPTALFVFAGETHLNYENFYDKNKSLIERNKEHLVFLGRLDEANLAAFYQSLSLFVLSSRSDCFALTQVEAMLAGVPVVVADIPGARVLVSETGFGELFTSEDPKALAEMIIKVINNRDDYLKNQKRVGLFLKKYDNAARLI